MEVQRTPVDNAPLLVNLLRLIRDARSPNYKDHEKGPVTFHLGGLCMRDTGAYDEAEDLWRCVAANHGSDKNAPFRGPLYLAVYLNHAPVEVWTLQDFREPTTSHSVPRDFEQLEQLNTLVRVLFAHLRSQEIYGVVLQSCMTTADDASVTQTDVFDGRSLGAASPLSPLAREATASSLRGPHSPLNQVSLRLLHRAEDCPLIPAAAEKRYLWSSMDFVRIDVVVNKAWRYQTTPPSSTSFPTTTQERSSPIKARSPASRTQAGDSDAASPSTSLEVTGSLAKSSLPTPHLAPTGTSPSSATRAAGVSPTSRISPLFTAQRKSPMPALSDFVLPPPELSELFDHDTGRQSRSSPLGPHNAAIFSSVVGGAATAKAGAASPVPVACPSGAATSSAVGHLEDAVWLADAPHVRQMGMLVSSGKDGSSLSPFSSPLGTKRKAGGAAHGVGAATSSFPHGYPPVGSLLATASVGALSGLDLDSQFGWSGAELDLMDDEDDDVGLHRDPMGGDAQSSSTTEALMSLLGLCSSAKLHHVAPAPFGDLVIALNLKDSSV